MRRRGLLAVALVSAVCGVTMPASAVVFGQVDDFTGGTTHGWSQGGASPVPTTVVSTGGPGGVGDAYLRNTSTGSGAGSKQIMFNQTRWIGNFTAAGITRLNAWVNNLGETDLALRLAFSGGPNSSRIGSSAPVLLPAGSGWTQVHFDVSSTGLSFIDGVDSISEVLAAVGQMRMLSAAAGPAFIGDSISSMLGLDGLRAMRTPGDANFDGAVSFPDLLALAKNYNSSGAAWSQGDFNFDGGVNFPDLLLLAKNYGSTPAAAEWALAQSLVPEPASGIGAALFGATALRRKRTMKSLIPRVRA